MGDHMLLSSISNMGSTLSQISKAVKTVSDNISNQDTPGYINKNGNFQSMSTESVNGNLISIGSSWQAQDVSTMAKYAAQEASKAKSEASRSSQAQADFSTYAVPLQSDTEIPGMIKKLQSGNLSVSERDQLMNDFNQRLSEQEKVFQRVKSNIQNGLNQISEGQVQSADTANKIYHQYQQMAFQEPNNPKIQELENQYSEIAGVPPIPVVIGSANGGKMKGMQDSQELLNKAAATLEKSYNDFKSQTDLNYKGEINYDSQYNSFQGSTLNGLNMDTRYTKESQVSAENNFKSNYGVNIEQETTKLSQLQNQYAAVVKVMQVQDQMLQSTLNIKA